jgi:two-component system CheB/CheR fusion protein
MKSIPPIRKKILFHKNGIKEIIFPIVAIGASAGGLEAVSQLLKSLPSNTGMAFIYVQHLSPDHKSLLTPILSKITKMKVQEIEEMENMVPNNVYVIPHNKEIKVIDGHIQLLPRPKNSSANLPIDVLFSSLAETHKDNVIGVILSGNANDGTKGIKAIKEVGGLTFAQDDSAQAGSMPESAIASGMVDYILSPKEIAHELTRLSKSGFLMRNMKGKQKEVVIEENNDLKTIFELLHKHTGVDFSHYKMATIKRRLNNRIVQCGARNTKEYAKILLKKSTEIDLLYKDLLINVTSFFRDTETFRYLKNTFLPKLLKNKKSNETLRIWIPACSTGEEAYSIAMLITELQDTKTIKIPVQIFATDLSGQVIHDARTGKYIQSDIEGISPGRLKRFFIQSGESFVIAEEIRKMCVFAPHNILRDPPFFRLDFISCRNLLIYFDAAAQKKTLAIMHFALNDGGYLLLGNAETIGSSSQLFTQATNKYKIFSRKKNTGVRKVPELAPRFAGTSIHEKNIKSVSKKSTTLDSVELDNAIDTILLSRFMPACAIINKEMEIIQFRGLTSLYLSHPSGKASLNILKMTSPECAFELRNAIHNAIKTRQSVQKSDIEMKINDAFQLMSLEVCPLNIEWDEPLFLIVFTMQEQTAVVTEKNISKESNPTLKDRKIQKLTTELNNARAEVLVVIESQEKAYEELQAANEEIISTNEEFQTLNEELETSKEEIESTNEELITSNHELKIQNGLLEESYNYSQTLIATIHEPMIVLDSNLHVKFANKSFYKKFHVTKEETEGMPLFKLGNKQWDIPELRVLLEDSLSKNSHFENFEVIHVFPVMGEKIMLLNASRIIQKTHREKLILLAIEDITERTRYYNKEKELLKNNISVHEADKIELEKAVEERTKQLNEKNSELESANKDLTSFTYVSSHDLQEPLRKIQNFVACMLDEEKANLSDDGKVYLQKTYETAKRMQSLIEDLLTYSRTKNTELQFEKMDLNIILDDVKRDFEDQIDERKVIIQIENLCEANIIPFQFRQLFQNLVSNSLKFSKPNIAPHISITSEIILGTKTKNEKLLPNVHYCHIVYMDNGIGFEAEYNERIFEVFQRLHGKKDYTGTGMGLAICKRIVENLNGIITASGKLNKGARFDIYFPA